VYLYLFDLDVEKLNDVTFCLLLDNDLLYCELEETYCLDLELDLENDFVFSLEIL